MCKFVCKIGAFALRNRLKKSINFLASRLNVRYEYMLVYLFHCYVC